MLTKSNITLRAMEPDDIDFLIEIENDTSFWHLSNTMLPYSRFDLEQYILMGDKDIYAQKQIRLIIEKTSAGLRTPIGAVDLFNYAPKHQRAGVGIILLETERSKGYAALAIDILVLYAREHLGLHQLYCNIEEDNESSVHLFTKKGFKLAGKKQDWNLRGKTYISEYLYQLIFE